MKKFLIGFLLIILAGVFVACGSDETEQEDTTVPAVEITDEEKVADEKVVAVINGEDVTGTTYNLVYSQLKLHAGQFNDEVDLAEIKEATMESIIDRQLVIQQAREEGIEFTAEDAELEFESIKSESSDALKNLLDQFQITEEEFKSQLQFEMTMNEYLAKAIEVNVTDEEVEEYYEEAKKENDDIPAYEEVKHQFKKQLLTEKTNEALESHIKKIKEKAEIEEKI